MPFVDYYRDKTETLEQELRVKKKKDAEKDSEIEQKDERLRFLENQLKAQEERYRVDIKAKQQEIKQYQRELTTKANTICELVAKLQAKRQQAIMNKAVQREDSSVSSSSAESPRAPAPPPDGTPRRRRSGHRIQGLESDSNPILQKPAIARAPSGRRLERPGIDEIVPDPAPFLGPTREVSATSDSIYLPKSRHHVPLPPISQSGLVSAKGKISTQQHYAILNQKYSKQKHKLKKHHSPLSSPEVETLAIDPLDQETRYWEADTYQSTDGN